jgi:hypothetical protein
MSKPFQLAPCRTQPAWVSSLPARSPASECWMVPAVLVMTLITPAEASAPNRAEPGPRMISMRSMALAGRPFQNMPLDQTRSRMGAPFTMSRVWVPGAPRMVIRGLNANRLCLT